MIFHPKQFNSMYNNLAANCGEPAILLHSYTVSLVQWVNPLLPFMRNLGSISRRVLMWNRDSLVSVVSLHWWPWCDWSLWPRLRQAPSQTVTRLLCRQCDNPIWSHTALLSWFHAWCRSSFRLHNRHSRLLGGSLWTTCNLAACILHTQSHWSGGSTLCFLSWGTRVQSRGGYSCETRILLLVFSRYNTIYVQLMWIAGK